MNLINWALYMGIVCYLVFHVLSYPEMALAQDEPAKQSNSEIQILEAQLDTMRDYNERILDTVHWSLGSLVLFAIFLIGYNWYSNFRVYERDKEALKSDLTTAIEKGQLDARHELDAQITRKIGEFETIFSSKLDDLEATQKSLRKTEKGEFTNAINGIRRELTSIYFDLEEIEYHKWLNRDTPVPANALTASVRLLTLAVKGDNKYHIEKVLDYLKNALSYFDGSNESRRLEAMDIGQVTSVLQTVPDEYQILVADLNLKIVEIRRLG